MFKDYKILVKDEEESKEVQEMLFKLGYKWASGDTVVLSHYGNILYTSKNGEITYGSCKETFEWDWSKELTLTMLKNMVDGISEQGVKTYNPLVAQEGGGHYKDNGIQPLEYTMQNNLSFCEGNVVKYISRYKSKNGIEDLAKVIHYALLASYEEYGEKGSTELRNKVLKLLGVSE